MNRLVPRFLTGFVCSVLICSATTAVAQAEAVVLKFAPVQEMAPILVESWLGSHGGLPEGETGASLLARGPVTREQTTLMVDEATNSLIVSGDAAAIAQIRQLATALDAAPIPMVVDVVVLEVPLPEKGGNSWAILADERNAAGLLEPDGGLDGLVKRAVDSGNAMVMARKKMIATNKKPGEAVLQREGLASILTSKIRASVNAQGDVSLELENVWDHQRSTSTLGITASLTSGQVLDSGSQIVTDENGGRTELLVLVQPALPAPAADAPEEPAK